MTLALQTDASLVGSKCIIHLDLDSFYAQVESVRRGLDSSVPLVVSQWNGILAVNYAARAFGIGRFDPIADAKRKCPHLVVQHVPTIASVGVGSGSGGQIASTSAALFANEAGKPAYHENPNINTHKASLVTYREASSKIMAIIHSHFPKTFQKASVDEAFIDCTEKVNEMITRDYHAGLMDASDDELPLVDWTSLQESTFMISYSDSDDDEKNLCDAEKKEKKILVATRGWKDLQLYYASKISLKIRTEIYEKLGYTSSTGIAHNKTLAKLVSSTNKPNKQTVLLEADVMEYMKRTKLTSIRGMGGKLGDKIMEEFTPCDVASDLWIVSLQTLVSKLGRIDGEWTYDICRGICHDPVKQSALTNSMQSCKNFRNGIADINTLQSWLRNLSSELYYRLLQEWEDHKRWPRTVSVSLRCSSVNNGGARPIHTKQSPFPHRDYISGPEDIYAVVEVIVLEVPRLVMPCWYIAIGLTGLVKVDMSMPLINTFFKVKEKEKDFIDLVKVVDGEQDKVCEEIKRVISPKGRKVGLVDGHGGGGGGGDGLVVADRNDGLDNQELQADRHVDVRELLKIIDQDTGMPLFFKCLECGDVFERSRMVEHGDYHLAASLARSGGGVGKKMWGTSGSSSLEMSSFGKKAVVKKSASGQGVKKMGLGSKRMGKKAGTVKRV